MPGGTYPERGFATKNPTIRAAGKEDLPQIVALLADDDLGSRREHAEGPLPTAYVDAFRGIDEDARNERVVTEAAGRIVATVQPTSVPSLTHQGGERARVEGVRVAAGHRGTGGLLFGWVESGARQRGCRMVQFTTDKRRPDALHFYEALGFRATHEGMKLPLA